MCTRADSDSGDNRRAKSVTGTACNFEGGSYLCGRSLWKPVERRGLTRDSTSVMPRLPVREISLKASGEEGADKGLQVGDAKVTCAGDLFGSQWRGGS